MKAKTLIFFVTLTVLALLLAACGGGGSDGGGGDASAGGQSFTIKVKDEFKFDPDTITVKAGDEVEITFENTGSIEHSFAILNAGVKPEDIAGASEDEQHELLLLEMHEVPPSESSTESFTAPSEPGDYIFVCAVPGHAEAGMVGTLTVTN